MDVKGSNQILLDIIDDMRWWVILNVFITELGLPPLSNIVDLYLSFLKGEVVLKTEVYNFTYD
jgi:hypothetical protein